MDIMQVISTITHGLDWFALIAMLAIAIFTAIKPYKAWHIFRSKKQEGLEPTTKSVKFTRRMGLVLAFLICVVIAEKII